jgi:hypothetical protein
MSNENNNENTQESVNKSLHGLDPETLDLIKQTAEERKQILAKKEVEKKRKETLKALKDDPQYGEAVKSIKGIDEFFNNSPHLLDSEAAIADSVKFLVQKQKFEDQSQRGQGDAEGEVDENGEPMDASGKGKGNGGEFVMPEPNTPEFWQAFKEGKITEERVMSSKFDDMTKFNLRRALSKPVRNVNEDEAVEKLL